MASSLLSFVITIVLVALGAAASGKGKMKKTRKFIPPNPAWRNGQPVQTAQGSSVQKNVPAAKKSSGSAILDRVPESKKAETAKPQQNGDQTDSTPQEPEETNGVDPRLLAILDADTYNEKYKLLSSMQGDMTDRLINDLAVALDIAVDDGPVDQRYEKLKSALAMLCKYEVNRLR